MTKKVVRFERHKSQLFSFFLSRPPTKGKTRSVVLFSQVVGHRLGRGTPSETKSVGITNGLGQSRQRLWTEFKG